MCVVLLDQTTKFYAETLGFQTTINPGVSFGFFPVHRIFLFAFVICVLGYMWEKMSTLFFSLVLGGTVSNIIDRIIFGGVRDWLPIPFFNLKNNIADWIIFLAVFLSVVQLANWKDEKR